MRRLMAAVVIVLATIFVGGGLPSVQAAPKVAPPFLESFGGEPLSLAALKGSAVILLFWAPW